MTDWQHALARLMLVGAGFLAAGFVSATTGALLWRIRAHLCVHHLKNALGLLGVAPAAVALAIALAPASALCEKGGACYLGWLQNRFGETASQALQALSVGIGGFWAWCGLRLARRALRLRCWLREMHALSAPPSEKLRDVLLQTVPSWARPRFREAHFAPCYTGVYGGTCYISAETVQRLDCEQLSAVVAHEWQHLRVGDGWYALLVGLVADSISLPVWRRLLERWSQCAEWLADGRAVEQGIRRSVLARVLLQHYAVSSVGEAMSGMVSWAEERLSRLLHPSRRPRKGGWQVCGACVVLGVLLLTAVWNHAEEIICTIHCALF